MLPCQTGAVVYDIGSSSIQFGFAGDAVPLYSVPSSACERIKDGEPEIQFGQTWLKKISPGITVSPIIDDVGAISNSNHLNSFFDWTSEACLNIEPAERPVLVTQPAHLHVQPAKFNKYRADLCATLFDFAEHPAVCLEYDAVLASFANALQTCTVCDFGWSCVRAIPVHEGRPLLKSLAITNAGGRDLCAVLESCLVRGNHPIKTHFSVQQGPPENHVIPTESQQKFCEREILQDIVKSCLSFESVPNGADSTYRYTYYMPGHNAVSVGEAMQWLGHWLASHSPQIITKRKTLSVDKSIYNAISSEFTPADIRRQLWGNIVMCGGLSNVPGLRPWIETNAKAPGNYATRVVPSKFREISGVNTVWAGGSILASLDNFQDFCITKEQWKEVGPNILLQQEQNP